jgi:hypothetical protein
MEKTIAHRFSVSYGHGPVEINLKGGTVLLLPRGKFFLCTYQLQRSLLRTRDIDDEDR